MSWPPRFYALAFFSSFPTSSSSTKSPYILTSRHRALHRTVADAVQGLLARVSTDRPPGLLAYCRENGRVCPQPRRWQALWEALPERGRVGTSWEPPLVAAKLGRRPVVPMLLPIRQRKQRVRSLKRIGDERPALTVARTHDARRQILAEQRSHCDVDTVAHRRYTPSIT